MKQFIPKLQNRVGTQISTKIPKIFIHNIQIKKKDHVKVDIALSEYCIFIKIEKIIKLKDWVGLKNCTSLRPYSSKLSSRFPARFQSYSNFSASYTARRRPRSPICWNYLYLNKNFTKWFFLNIVWLNYKN